jgi:hypothetical protein
LDVAAWRSWMTLEREVSEQRKEENLNKGGLRKTVVGSC